MSLPEKAALRIAIACGGTGGHLFPGLAVAEQLRQRDCEVTLLISPKQVDQQAAAGISGMEVLTIPAVGLTRGRFFRFVRGFAGAYIVARRHFRQWSPQAALAMGGFTSAPPILAARAQGARTFLHESNTIPGRANRWLSRMVDRAFVGFPATAARLHNRNVTVTGTPVRLQFAPAEAAGCRAALELDPARPVVLIMGGSQGASGINDLVTRALPLLKSRAADWQWLHLAGQADVERVRQAYGSLAFPATVHAFFDKMEQVLGAATCAVSRAGAASLSELAAMRLPAILVPYPAATDNHQFHNARAFVEPGAALLLEQSKATPETFAALLQLLMTDTEQQRRMQTALARQHAPQAAAEIAEAILSEVSGRAAAPQRSPSCGSTPEDNGRGSEHGRQLRLTAAPMKPLQAR